MFSQIRPSRLTFTVFVAAFLVLSCSARGDVTTTEKEIKMGREAAKDIEREIELVSDKAIQSRLNIIGDKLAAQANVTPVIAAYGSSHLSKFDYVFKIVDEKEVNAFALPGGHIYVNKGLIDYVKSDDELAAVLAHEIAHVAHHHSLKLMKKQSKMDVYLAAITLLGAFGNIPGRDMSNLVYGAQLVKVSKMGGYSQTAEADADRTSITYMQKAGYDTTAMVAFMQRMAKDAADSPQLPLGIFRTHPPYHDRIDCILAEMDKLGIKRSLMGSELTRTAVVNTTSLGDKQISEVAIAGKVIYRPADIPGSTSAQRAYAIAASLNSYLSPDDSLSRTRITCDETCVRLNGELVVTIHPEDLALHQTTADEVIQRFKDTIQFAIWCGHVESIKAT